MHPTIKARDIATLIRSKLMGMAADDKLETLYDLNELLSTMMQEYHDDAFEAGLLMPGFTEDRYGEDTNDSREVSGIASGQDRSMCEVFPAEHAQACQL